MPSSPCSLSQAELEDTFQRSIPQASKDVSFIVRTILSLRCLVKTSHDRLYHLDHVDSHTFTINRLHKVPSSEVRLLSVQRV